MKSFRPKRERLLFSSSRSPWHIMWRTWIFVVRKWKFSWPFTSHCTTVNHSGFRAVKFSAIRRHWGAFQQQEWNWPLHKCVKIQIARESRIWSFLSPDMNLSDRSSIQSNPVAWARSEQFVNRGSKAALRLIVSIWRFSRPSTIHDNNTARVSQTAIWKSVILCCTQFNAVCGTQQYRCKAIIKTRSIPESDQNGSSVELLMLMLCYNRSSDSRILISWTHSFL